MSLSSDIIHYLRVYRSYIGRRVYLVFVLTGLAALAEGFGITLLLPLLRAAESTEAAPPTGGVEGFLHSLLETVGMANSLVGILGFIALSFAAKGLLKFAESGYAGYLQAQLLRELKSQLFDVYSTMQYRHYIQRSTGHFINVINQQVANFLRSFGNFSKFLSQIITTISYFAIAFALTWKFAIMALMVGGTILLFFRYLSSYVRELSRRTSKEASHLNGLLVQSLQGFKYILSTNQTSQLRGGVMASIRRLTGYMARQNVAQAFTGAIKEPVSVVFIVMIIGLQVTVFEQPVAPIFVAILLFHRGMQAMVAIQSKFQQTMNRIGALEMVDEEFQTVKARQETTGSKSLPPLSDGIEFQDAHFAYDEEEGDVLEAIDVTIPVNNTVAFVGESGAGKSTLIDMLTLLLKPRRGAVRIDGIHHDDIDLASWRSQIGYVSQEAVMFDDSVANNITLWQTDGGEHDSAEERMIDAAKRAHAHHFICDLPDGYETTIGDRGVRLSGGQRQRLFVARELFKDPNLLILDEATSALDTESEKHIQESIDALKGEMTVVTIAHRLSTIKNVDYVYVLEDGRVVEEGPYSTLRQRTGSRFRQMIEMQKL